MRYCPNCGYQIYTGENFCAMCDTPLEWVVPYKHFSTHSTYEQHSMFKRDDKGNCAYCYAPLIGKSLGWVSEDYGLTRKLCPVWSGEKVVTRTQYV